MMNMRAVSLPPAVKRQIARLPDAARDIVAQRLRDPPRVPVVYEEAIKQLASVRDIETTKRVLLAAEGLALWGKLHDDNRAIMEAQKLKAHALRQMFICAKMLGEPYEVLLDKKIYRAKARRGEELASFPDKDEIDAIADALGGKGRPEHLVGKIAERSPLFRSFVAENVRRREDHEREIAERDRRLEEKSAKPPGKQQRFLEQYAVPLVTAGATIRDVSNLDFGNLSDNNKKILRDEVAKIMEALDQIDEECQ